MAILPRDTTRAETQSVWMGLEKLLLPSFARWRPCMVSSESTFFVSRNTCVVFIFTQPLYMLLDIGEELTPGYISILQSYHVSKYEPKPVESLLPIRILYREQRNPRMSCQKTICTSREYAMCLHSIQVHFAQTPCICNLRQD